MKLNRFGKVTFQSIVCDGTREKINNTIDKWRKKLSSQKSKNNNNNSNQHTHTHTVIRSRSKAETTKMKKKRRKKLYHALKSGPKSVYWNICVCLCEYRCVCIHLLIRELHFILNHNQFTRLPHPFLHCSNRMLFSHKCICFTPFFSETIHSSLLFFGWMQNVHKGILAPNLMISPLWKCFAHTHSGFDFSIN